MERYRMMLAAGAALSLAMASTGSVLAQTEEPAETMAAEPAETSTVPEADIIVTGVEYAYLDLPISVPAGTTMGFENAGIEVHELVLFRVSDETTASIEELLAMEDPISEGLVEQVGEQPLLAASGATAAGTLTVDQEGRYVAICFIPQGLTDFDIIAEIGPDTDPSALPPEVQELLANPPHFVLGMIQEFQVTSVDSTPGPLPTPAPAEEPMAEPSLMAEGSPTT